MKNSKIYPWIVVGLLWGGGTAQLYGPADAQHDERGHAD